MGPKRKHQPVQQESDHETVKPSKSPSKKKRPRKNKNDSIVKEENSSVNADVKPNVSTLEITNEDENHIEENFEYENNDTTVASEDGGVIEPKIEQDLPTWPTNDLEILLGKVEEVLPPRDNLRFKSRLAKLDWESLRFGDYSSDQCRQMWEFVQKHIRCYRLLGEIISDAKAWVSQPWTSYRNYKKKPHPEMPRRPLSCYMIYYMRNKSKVLKKNPKMDMPSLSKHISEMYKKLSNAKREKYMKQAEIQRDAYMEKLREFYKKYPELEPKSQKQKMLALNVPKKPFKLYYDSKLKDADDKIDRNIFLKKCKRKWKNLTDEKKCYWIDLALSQKGTNIDSDDTDANDVYKKKMQNLLTKEERHLKEKLAGKPERPPTSAYGLFTRNLLGTERIQGINPKERIVTISQEWKKCSEQEKESWKQKLTELIEKYKIDYTTYLESLTEEERAIELTNNLPKPRKRKVTEDEDTGASNEAINEAINDAINNVPLSPDDASDVKIVPIENPKKKKQKQKINNSDDVVVEEVSPSTTILPEEPPSPPSKPIELFAASLKNTTKLKKSVENLWEELSIKEKEKYRKKLDKLKTTYIVKYEKYLKSLTPEQLKLYYKIKTSLASTAAENESDSESNDEDDESDDDSGDENVEEVNVKQETIQSEDEESVKSEGEASSSSGEEDDSDDSSD